MLPSQSPMFRPILLLVTLLVVTAGASARGGTASWRTSYDAALAEAKDKNLPIFIAIGHDSEEVCREMASTHYADDGIDLLLQNYVCLIASRSRHKVAKAGEQKVCSLYGTITCDQHIAVESKVRSEVLGSDLVTIPQHVIISPQGKLLEAREYYLSVAVLKRLLSRHLAEVRPDLALGKDVASEVSQGKIGDSLREALRSEDREKRAAAIRLLADFDPEEILRAMDATFAAMSMKERSAMLIALGAPGFRIAVPILSRHLVGNDAQMRASAAQALGKLADTQAIIPLRRRLSTEPDAVARGCVVEALATFASKDEAAAKAVVQAAGDREPIVRAHACVALAGVEGASADQALLKALDAKDRTAAGAAVWACGKRRFKAAEKKIKEIMKAFPDIRFKVVAEAAMKRIRGEPVDDAFFEEQRGEFLEADAAGGK